MKAEEWVMPELPIVPIEELRIGAKYWFYHFLPREEKGTICKVYCYQDAKLLGIGREFMLVEYYKDGDWRKYQTDKSNYGECPHR